MQGIVQTYDGTRVAGAHVTITGGGKALRVSANGNGEFVVENLAPGTYVVTAEVPTNSKVPPPPNGAVGGIGAAPEQRLVVKSGVVARSLIVVNRVVPQQAPPYDDGPCCKPYGAPPARRRVV
jgi:hypothetical protein